MGNKAKRLVIKVLAVVNMPFYLVRLLFVVLACLMTSLSWVSVDFTDEQQTRFCAAMSMSVWYFGIIGTVLLGLVCDCRDTCFNKEVDALAKHMNSVRAKR